MKLKVLSGAAFDVSLDVADEPSGLDEEAQALADLSAAISSKVSEQNDPSIESKFSILTGGIDDYSKAAAGIRGLTSV